MRFLVDANLPRSLVDLISRLNHQVEFVRDVGMSDAPDSAVAERAQKTGAILLTRDLDFADIRNYPPERYPGIVVLRLPDDVVAAEIVSVAERFLREASFASQISARLAIVERDRVRFRPPLASQASTQKQNSTQNQEKK